MKKKIKISDSLKDAPHIVSSAMAVSLEILIEQENAKEVQKENIMRYPCSVCCKYRDTNLGGNFCSFNKEKRPCIKDPTLIPTQRQTKEVARKALREFWKTTE